MYIGYCKQYPETSDRITNVFPRKVRKIQVRFLTGVLFRDFFLYFLSFIIVYIHIYVEKGKHF